MNKLELKHLAPYLPYGLELMMESEPGNPEPYIIKMFGVDQYRIQSEDSINVVFGNCKPILRPLSDLTLTDAEEFMYPDEGHLERSLLSGHAPYSVWINFVSEHYDVFGLIESNLAIDINTL